MKPFRTVAPSQANSARDAWLILLTTSHSIPAVVQNLSAPCWNWLLSPVSFHGQEAEQRSSLSSAEEEGACFHYRRSLVFLRVTKGHAGRCGCFNVNLEFKSQCFSTEAGGSTDQQRWWLFCLSFIFSLPCFPSFHFLMRHRANIKAGK